MNQPHNPIRPRRRQPMVAGAQPVMARPEQSTRILIRVPTVASGSTGSKHAQVVEATSGKKLSAAPQVGAKLPDVVSDIVLTEVKWSGADSAQPSATPSVQPSMKPKVQPSATPSAASKSQLRIDAGHVESLRPHLAETKKGSWTWWTDPSQRRAMIAVALIVGAVVVIAIMLHNESQHRTMQASDDRNVKVLRTSEAKEPTPPQAASPWNGQGQNAMANRPTTGNGFTSAVGGLPAQAAPAIGNPAIGQGPSMSTPQYRAADSQNNYSAPMNNPGAVQNYSGGAQNQTPWKTPAGSNMPARVDPINATQPPTNGPSQQASPETVYSAQRNSLPVGSDYRGSVYQGGSGYQGAGDYRGGDYRSGDYRGGDYRATGGQQGAAFNGGINNPAMQISR